jgi:hypothetical protein
MKKQPGMFFDRSLDSLVLAVDHFNRPWDRGRKESVLILLDRAFELLLKAIILHKGGKIREPYAKETIGFYKCVRKCLTDVNVKCLTEDQALTLQIINSVRDAAQHDIVELSEHQLYLYAQAGLTVYRDLLDDVLGESLSAHVPERVLPVSAGPPRDLHTMVETDFAEIRRQARAHSRQQLEARAKLKSLAIIEASLGGVRSQPSELEINALLKRVRGGEGWADLFPGVASLATSVEGSGLSVAVRITKKEGEAVTLVPEGTPGATVLAVKRVNELDYYSLGLTDLAEKVGLTSPRALALVQHLALQESEDFYKELKVGKSVHKRYSPKALERMREALPTIDIEAVWEANRPKQRKRRA